MKRNSRRQALANGLGTFALLSMPGALRAQDARPLRILVGFPAGGGLDSVVRLVSERISRTLNQPVIVDNRAGASGRIATMLAKEAAADGLTLLASPAAVFTLYPHMLKTLRYDPFKDFMPLAKLVAWDLALAVPTNSPVNTFAQFVEIARKDPKQALYASPSAGSPLHFLGLELGNKFGISLEHVSFKGGRDAATALAGGQVPAALLNLGDLMELHRAGRARILTIFSNTRSSVLPEVPTIRELGHPELVFDGWVAMYARVGTPEPTVQRLQSAINDALQQPVVSERIVAAGGRTQIVGRPQLEELTKLEFARWREVVQRSGYKEE